MNGNSTHWGASARWEQHNKDGRLVAYGSVPHPEEDIPGAYRTAGNGIGFLETAAAYEWTQRWLDARGMSCHASPSMVEISPSPFAPDATDQERDAIYTAHREASAAALVR